MSIELIIDPEFKALIPPLTDYELKNLEDSIIAEGCRDPLVIWGDILIDGHNRYNICSKHDIKFNTVQVNFDSRDEALLWIIRNQLSRRNLKDIQRVELVRKCENAVKAQARERQLSGLLQNDDTVVKNFPQREMEAEKTSELCILATRGNPILTDTHLPIFTEASEKNFVELIKEIVGDMPVYELS